VVATIAMTTTDAAATPIAPTLISRLNAVATPNSRTTTIRPIWVVGSNRGSTEDTGRHGMWRSAFPRLAGDGGSRPGAIG
jgi:hypothetical protein